MKVLIVDDSIIFRKGIEKALTQIPGIIVIGSSWNGLKALEFLQSLQVSDLPDLITLDVEMPEMDGLQTLQEIQKINYSHQGKKTMQVLMVSSLTKEGAKVTISALQQGAFDFITKPENLDSDKSVEFLRDAITEKIKIISGKDKGEQIISRISKLETKLTSSFRCIGIGISTGGPKTLMQLLPPLCEATNLPILIVQHMPEEFTKSLAANLDRYTSHRVKEAEEGETISDKTVYIAPGGKHMVARYDQQGKSVIGINDHPAENGCKPSVDILFRSLASIFADKTIALILTGMGNDGTRGLATLKRAGAHVIAQDEASSTIWGMPGSAVKSGVTDEVLPLDEIPSRIRKILHG